MTTPEEYLADERRLDWQEQQAEMQREREEKILEDLGHIEAAGMIEEAARLRDFLCLPREPKRRHAPVWDGVSDPF